MNRKGRREALKQDEGRGAGSKGSGSGGTSSEKNAGGIIAYIDRVKPFTHKMVWYIIDSSSNGCFRIIDVCVSRKGGRDN